MEKTEVGHGESKYTPTPEQLEVINHDPDYNGRVLAGPGTGKSSTAVALVRRLAETHPSLRTRMITFTRAATAELGKKVGDASLDNVPLSTIHSFALSILVRFPGTGNIPEPLRILGRWEQSKIRSDIARRLRERGFKEVNVYKVRDFENEMAGIWQSLDPNYVMLSDLEPELRNAYVGLWQQHRQIFGYTLLSELPFRAGHAVEDFDLNPDAFDFLVVDEYQDLNKADIKLIHLIANRGPRVLAIGDDDQSIYGLRMAAPQGILNFHNEFEDTKTYELTTSHRCPAEILKAASTLIQAAPDRPPKKALTPNKDNANAGRYLYLRFPNEASEASAVADLIAIRKHSGVPLSEIAVLVRSQASIWAKELIPALAERDIVAVDVNWIDEVFENSRVLRGLSSIRLALHREDSLAWWTLLSAQRGVSPNFIDYIYDAVDVEETFGRALLRLHPEFSKAPTSSSAKIAAQLVGKTLLAIEQIQTEGAELGQTGWGGWIIDQLDRSQLSSEAIKLFEDVGRVVPPGEGVGHFLGQLEPVARDLATQADAVRIMSMAASKGLTVNTCVVMGVENGLIPHPRGKDVNEERRLLYVAMTRATDMCVFTFASRRTGPTAHQGSSNVYGPRGRSPLLDELPGIGHWQEGAQVIEELRQEESRG